MEVDVQDWSGSRSSRHRLPGAAVPDGDGHDRVSRPPLVAPCPVQRRSSPVRHALMAVGLIALASAAPAGQTPPSSPQPTFRAAVELIAVDAAVVDERGAPVAGLTAADFEVSVDGTPRRIVSAQLVRLAPGEPSAAPATVQRLGYSTNEGGGAGRLVLLVFDLEGIGGESAGEARKAAFRLLEQLSETDRVGVLAYPNGPRVEFTADRERVREAVRDIAPRRAPVFQSEFSVGYFEALEIERGEPDALRIVVDRECESFKRDPMGFTACQAEVEALARATATAMRARNDALFATLRNLLGSLAQIEAPKTIVWISGGVPLDDVRAEPAEIARLAAASRTTLYALHLEGAAGGDASRVRPSATVLSDRNVMREGLATIASAARGALFTAIGDFDAAGRIAREMSAYYLLSVEPEPADRDGKTHQIDVRVRRPGVTVRARREFTMGDPAKTLTPEQRLAALIRQPVPAVELPVKVATYCMRAPGSRDVRLVIATEFGRGDEPQPAAMGFVLLDGRDKVVASSFQQYRAAPVGAGRPAPLHISTTAQVAPGEYRLRVAVLDGDGRAGSVEHPVSAKLAGAGDLEVADLVLSPAGNQGGGRSVQVLADVAIASHPFAGYLELYPRTDAAARAAQVRFEIADPESGSVLAAADARVVPTREQGRLAAQGLLPVDALSPGDYVARAVVTAGGASVVRARPFRLVVPRR
ncbi:MAG TPA: VWA domain-containing protein [Vicinamibacterales bacterium]